MVYQGVHQHKDGRPVPFLTMNDMTRKLLLLLFAALLQCHPVWAVPARPVRKSVTMPDGTTQVVTLQGDEHLSFYLAENGQRGLVGKDGRFTLLPAERFEALRQQAAIRRQTAEQRRNSRLASPKPGRKVTTVGRQRGLVILVAFSDLDFTMTDPNATYQRFFNEEGYTESGMSGSVHDYFSDQSYGQFDLTFDVYGPVKLSRSYAYYGRNSEDRKDVNVRKMITESLQQMDDAIDYTRYDWDGDGAVDQVFFIYAGYCEAQGAEENTIWPHESSIDDENLVLDGKRLGTYGCSGELMGASGTHLDGIGTACHEFTHCLGLPDFYDTGYTGGYGMASWDLMSAGSYNNNSRTPAGYTSYERWASGWLEPTVLKGRDPIRVSDMKPIAESPEAYVLYNDREPNEYYLLENRQFTGWDGGLPGHGLLMLHVDYDEAAWRGNTLNMNPTHQRLTVIPADNNTVDNWSGMAGDPYPGTSGNHSLTNHTTPAATLFNRNSDRTLFMNKPIENIQESADGRISFVALHPELAVPEPRAEKQSATSFTIRWDAVDLATHYEVQLTETPASKHDLEECLLFREDFPKCVTSSAGFSDISGNLNNYLTNRGWSGSKLYTSPGGLRFGTSSDAGYLRTAAYQVPESGEVTLVVDVAPFAEGTPVEGEVRFVYDGRWSTYTSVPFSVSTAGRYLFHCTDLYDAGAIDLRPSSRMYITYMALYEGNWSEEELAGTRASAPRRIKQQTLSTEATSLTVEDANPTSTYAFSVRALTDENIVSQWSESVTFSLDETPVVQPAADLPVPDGFWFDLAGRRVQAPTQSGIYLRNGRKTVVH